ncbi:MAG: hypothetical protein QOI55_782 [Actinomycetota bacterium]|nr:hypothetical protein [Actinomycetota bacterium]
MGLEDRTMTRRPNRNDMSALDVAGVIRVHAAQRQLAAEVDHPICGEFIAFEGRHRVHVCALERHHSGPHL